MKKGDMIQAAITDVLGVKPYVAFRLVAVTIFITVISKKPQHQHHLVKQIQDDG